jgi:cell division transport system permease protein
MKQWLNQHGQALGLVLGRMRRNLAATLMMCCVMGVTLCLPGTLYVVVDNLNRLAGGMHGDMQISLFLKLDITKDGIAALDSQLSQHTGIAEHRFVAKEQAWQEMQSRSGLGEAAGKLDSNPLPDAFFVSPKSVDPDSIEQLRSEMQQWPGVELAQLDADWIKRLYALLELGRKAILVLAALLGFALLAIIGNTIRLQILTQREEIEVSKLIGATNGFIRRPFLYAGTLYGLCGGLVAWLLLAGVIAVFNQSIADLAALYASDFRLELPVWQPMLALLLGAMALGWLGSYIAVNRSLARLGLD